MADLQKFKDLLSTHHYSILEYFSQNGICMLTKVIHNTSGCIFFIYVSKSYKLTVDSSLTNHYNLLREDMSTKEPTNKELSEIYPHIKPTINQYEVIDDISNKLELSYKQPIILQQQSSMQYVEQLKRLKFCFKLLDVKLLVQTEQYIIKLNTDNLISIFRIENYPKTNENKFFMIVSLEHFFDKINTIFDIIQDIEIEFYNILNLNQEKHNQYFNIEHIEYFIRDNDNVLLLKHKYHEKYREMCDILAQLEDNQNQLTQKLNEIIKKKSSHNFYKDAETIKQKTEVENSLKRIYESKQKMIRELTDLDSKLRNIYLIVDQLGFNFTITCNELKSELHKIQENKLD